MLYRVLLCLTIQTIQCVTVTRRHAYGTVVCLLFTGDNSQKREACGWRVNIRLLWLSVSVGHAALSFDIIRNNTQMSFRLRCKPNPRIALGGKKSHQLSFWVSKKILFSIGRCLFVTFPEYEVGIYNQIANRCTGSCLAWRQTRVIFLNWRNFMVILNMTKQIENKHCCK